MDKRSLWVSAGFVLAILFVGVYMVLTPKTEINSQKKIQSSPQELEESNPEETSLSDQNALNNGKSEAVDVLVEASEFKFSPSVIKVRQGQTVNLTLVNKGSSFHNFVVDELNIDMRLLSAGETEEITFTPQESGVYTFYCSFTNHRDLGMTGELIIEQSD